MTIHAKSAFGHFSVSLAEHTRDVLDASEGLFGIPDSPTRLAQEWCRFLKLPDTNAFLKHLRLACCLHDLGKSNSGFQAAVTGQQGSQCLPHEHLSALLIWDSTLRDRMHSDGLDFDVVLIAVAGHHLRVTLKNLGEPTNPDMSRFTVLEEGIRDVLELTQGVCGISDLSTTVNEADEVWSLNDATSTAAARTTELRGHLKKWRRLVKRCTDNNLRNLTIAVRAALIVADAAGSGFVRVANIDTRKTAVQNHLSECFDNKPYDGEAIDRLIIQPRLAEINRKLEAGGKSSFKWHCFQDAAAKLGPRSLLLAGCGSGKTLAAWRWIQAQADRKPVSRVIFLYPTRATATEGFRDYVSWAPEGALATGTASYELQGMFGNPADVRAGREYTTDDRLFAIGYWHRRIFSATVDQFLGFMQHSYRSMCLLPMLVDSVVVFDEIHSFDQSLFSAFRRFLREFDIPTLCMTASLPGERVRSLKDDCGLTVFPDHPQQFADLHRRAEMPRYEVRVVERNEVDDIVCQARDAGRKILWVVNTIRRCQEIAQQHDAICYHSGFTLDDRKSRHAEVISQFQEGSESVLAVTTQVCEMSLDLDAWLLVTEFAPIPAMIQRLGRCNRHAEPDSGLLGQVLFYEPENQMPYSEADMSGVSEFLTAIDGRSVGQLELQELLEEHGPSEADPEKYAAFVQSGPWAKAHEESLRDASDFTVQAILDNQIEEFLDMQMNRKSTDGFVLPTPRWMAEPADNLPRWLSSGPAELYSSDWGLDRGPAAREFIAERERKKDSE